ncbi:MAG: NAD(+)/NADH kinase [Desulfobulbus oligotrophicus]|jgi:NAD+ kinase|nr:NAD(+)/NADH kinase [Desulfobulbus oligotrophicus]
MNIQYAGVITRPDSPEVDAIGREMVDWFKCRSIRADFNRIDRHMDILIVLGGDGTLLHVADKAAEYQLPVLGINLGNLGFLTEIAAEERYEALELLLVEDDVRLETRIMLSAAYVNGTTGEKSASVHALNEVVIVKKSTEAMIRLRCWADREYVTTYRADGLIIATPTGSTAYNLSAGGPVVHAELDAVVVTPICPFMLESRPILLGSDHNITAQLLAPAGEVKVIIDGGLQWTITENDYLQVRKASLPLLIVSSPWKSYFNILRNKLNWGGASVDIPLPEKACKHC